MSVAAASDFPNAVTVGQTGVPASITVTNTSTPPNAVGNVTLGTITLVPSCGTFAFTCDPAFADPGVFSLSPTATGEAGTVCAGTTFTITVIDPALGKVQLIPNNPVVLGPPGGATATCGITFTFSVNRRPNIDAMPATPGLQTAAIFAATGSQGGLTSTGSAVETIVVNAASPTLSTTASAPVALGGQVGDTATISGGFNPTGTITFNLFGPNNSLCTGTPGFTSGFWFVNGSAGVNATTYWGAPGDVPVVLPASIRPVAPPP